MDDVRRALLLTRDTLMYLPLALFCFLPVYRDIKSRMGRLILKLLISSLGMEILMFLVYFVFPDQISSLVGMLLFMGGFLYLYQKEIGLPRFRLWFIFMTACVIGAFSYLVYHMADILLFPAHTIKDSVELTPFLVQITFELAAILILLYPAKKHLGWLVHCFQEERVWRLVWVFPAAFVFFAYFFVPYDNSVMYLGMYEGRFMRIYMLALFVLLILVLFIYIMFYKIAYSFVEKQEMIRKAGYLEMQAEQYHTLLSYVQETSRLRHDFRHQLTVIAEMAANGHYEELEKYMEQYTAGISDMSVIYCASSAVNALLNHYAAQCRELGIKTCFGIRLQEKILVEDIDFCVLLGNLLENAVDECRNLPEPQRQVHLKIGQTSERVIVLQISNPCRSIAPMQEGRILSSKHSGEGQGLKSVQLIAEKYNGFMEAGRENGFFAVKVLLNL